MSQATVLVVDDDRANQESVARIFQREGLATLSASNGQEALELLRRPEVAVVVTDLMMPGMDGQELLKAARAIRPDVEVVLMTAYATVETAVAAMKDGAYDFITKPLKRHSLVKAVQKALEKQALVAENRDLKARLDALGGAGGRMMAGQSPAFRACMETLKQAAPATATVLLMGESGTGKELAARFVHEHSARARGPFIAINCAALPEGVLEAELFGVEKGAFTGAVARREGRFERANGGTLFLDEVGEMSAAAQVKLLRVLQEGEIERLGGTQTIKVDVRVIAATNKELQKEVAEGRFREDLFYRLNVVAVRLPSLASRREDIPLLADYFLRRYAQKNAKAVGRFSPEALAVLENYAWPGNVRELENVVERAVVLCRADTITPSDLPPAISGRTAPLIREAPAAGDDATWLSMSYALAKEQALRRFEKGYVEALMRACENNISAAARKAGMDRSNFKRVLRKYRNDVESEPGDEPPETPRATA